MRNEDYIENEIVGRDALLDGGLIVRVEDFANGMYWVTDEDGGEKEVCGSRLDPL